MHDWAHLWAYDFAHELSSELTSEHNGLFQYLLSSALTRSVQQKQCCCWFFFLAMVMMNSIIKNVRASFSILWHARSFHGSISGLVVKFPLAMREPRVRFPADASFSLPTTLGVGMYFDKSPVDITKQCWFNLSNWKRAFSSIGRAHA